MLSADVYIILWLFAHDIPFWIEDYSFTNYMFWFYLAQWLFIFEHYKASIYIEKRLQLFDEELEIHS